MVSHSLIAIGAVRVRVPLYFGTADECRAHPSPFVAVSFPNLEGVVGWCDGAG